MAHFYGTVQGNRGDAARMGSIHSGFSAVAASFQGAVDVHLYHVDGVDKARIRLKPWQGAGVERTLYDGPVGSYEAPKPAPTSGMDAADALQIVLDLARQNIIDDPDMEDEAARQSEACDIVEDIAVNQFGDD